MIGVVKVMKKDVKIQSPLRKTHQLKKLLKKLLKRATRLKCDGCLYRGRCRSCSNSRYKKAEWRKCERSGGKWKLAGYSSCKNLKAGGGRGDKDWKRLHRVRLRRQRLKR